MEKLKPKTPEMYQSNKISTTTERDEKIPQEDQNSDDRVQNNKPLPNSNNPTPMDLDIFLPWICLQWQCCDQDIIVKRVIQEQYVSKREKQLLTSRTKPIKPKPSVDKDKSQTSEIANAMDIKSAGSILEQENTIKITTVYDLKGNLLEIVFHKQYDVPLKVIYILNFCFPWHTFLTKFTFCEGGLTSGILQEMAKFLPNSNITDLILNGNYVPEGNYYILFENTSNLRHLSLSRCSLNDRACGELLAKLESGHSIQLLDLSCNDLTDDSAQAIGHVLRLNRTLLHLNISGNKITTRGACAILDSLAKFPLTVKELMDMKRKKIMYISNKISIYTRCLEDITKRANSSKKPVPQTGKPLKNSKSEKSLVELAERMAAQIAGEFNHPHNSERIVTENKYLYCTGNFTLCSLNLSYNNLDYLFVKHIHKVLKYQNECVMHGETGLLRVVIEGNNFPNHVSEYLLIEELLRLAVFIRSPSMKIQK